MKRWRRDIIKKEKAFQRNVWIALALLLVAFLAKIEAINFLLALPVGIMALMYVLRWQQRVYQRMDDSINNLSPWILSLILGLIMAIFRWRIEFLLPTVAGLFSGYLVYSTLNFLFISP